VGTRIEVTLNELREVRHRIDHKQLEATDWALLGALVSKQIARAEDRQERMAAKVAAAAAAAEKDTEEPVPNTNASSDAATHSASSPDTSTPSPSEPESADTPSGDANGRKGHGRNGASAYRSAEHFHYTLPSGVIGAPCDACKHGNMTHYREKTIVRIKGQPLFAAEQHHYEQGRCRNCGRIVRAEGPAYVQEGLGTDYIRYDWSACAFLMVMHYSSSSPFRRLDSLHDGWGVPMSDANQWELVDQGDDALLPMYRAIENHAIQKSTNFRIDDTQSVVISLNKQIAAELAALRSLGESTKDVRTGINATGSYWETPDGPIVLFYTGRHHAGEIVDQVMRRRLLSSPKLVKCTDGASKNFDHEHADTLIEATCNAHAFLKFRAIKDKYPTEYAEAGRVYHVVFDNDDKAEALGLDPVERMLYHRQHSKPLMLELKTMCEERIKSKRVEPNSPLWEPVTFVINQWERLVCFCEVPGVPLDTNLVEQALIMPVRYLAGSFNYQTENGAVVGDHSMSIIATARANDVEPVAYITDCLRNREDLAKRPEYYLPWVWRQRCEEASSPRAPPSELRDLAPEIGEGATGGVAAPDQDLQLAGE
jgi:hypothetical protein